MLYAKLLIASLVVVTTSAVPVSARFERQQAQKTMTYSKLQKMALAYQSGKNGHRGAFLKTAMLNDPASEFSSCMTACSAEYSVNSNRCMATPTANPSDYADCQSWAESQLLSCESGCRAIW